MGDKFIFRRRPKRPRRLSARRSWRESKLRSSPGHSGATVDFLVNLQVLRISIRMDGVFTWHGAFLMGMWEKERHFSLDISAVHNSSEAPKEPKATEADHRELLCCRNPRCFLNSFAFERFPGFPPFRSNMCCENLHNLNQTNNSPELGQFIDVDGGAGPHHEVQRKERLQWSDGVAWIMCTFGHTCCHHVGSAFHPISKVNLKRQIHSVCL